MVRAVRVEEGWDWETPPTFGGVCSGECEVFLCQDGQGGRGRGDVERTFGPGGDDAADKGAWMSIWVEDIDAVHRHCVEQWGVREMHVRHPDGHVFRIGRGIDEA